ncbi:MAG: hypothetical protein FIA98_05660, partial [Anaerolineae bacterium]|nr:hypothetical protein [Anaerolineae bacterium]
MTENLNENLRSLLIKLSAVRVTLTDAEQSLLDQLILGSEAEVKAQALKFQAPDEVKMTGADEVKAQVLKFQAPDEVK